MWRFFNANPNKLDVEDCAVRSISTIEGISWDKAYEKLSYYARKKRLMMNSVEFIEEYLDERYKRKCHYGITVGEFARKHPYGKYLVTMPGHITAIKNGIIVDTFDCSMREMWCSWKVEQ